MGGLYRALAITALALSFGFASQAEINATAAGQWISIGIPSRMNVGTTGQFYLIGNDHGTCAGQPVTYFRFDMNGTRWKEVYALLLAAAASQKYIQCVVETGCGTTEVWATYCSVTF